MEKIILFKATCKCGNDNTINLPGESAAQEYAKAMIKGLSKFNGPPADMTRHEYTIAPMETKHEQR